MNLHKQEFADMIKDRHTRLSSSEEWTNHHGLYRCDCEELVEWVESLDD